MFYTRCEVFHAADLHAKLARSPPELFRESRDDYCSSRRSSVGECVLGIILRAIKFGAAIVHAIARCSADAHNILDSRCRVAATAAARRSSEALRQQCAFSHLLSPLLRISPAFLHLLVPPPAFSQIEGAPRSIAILKAQGQRRCGEQSRRSRLAAAL